MKPLEISLYLSAGLVTVDVSLYDGQTIFLLPTWGENLPSNGDYTEESRTERKRKTWFKILEPTAPEANLPQGSVVWAKTFILSAQPVWFGFTAPWGWVIKFHCTVKLRNVLTLCISSHCQVSVAGMLSPGLVTCALPAQAQPYTEPQRSMVWGFGDAEWSLACNYLLPQLLLRIFV